MVRYHYESKEKLWCAAFDYLFERASQEVFLAPEEFDAHDEGDLDVYRNFLRRAVSYSARHPEHARIAAQESILKSARLDYYAGDHVREHSKTFDELVRLLKKHEVVPENMTTLSYYYMLTGAISNLFMMTEEAKIAFKFKTLNDGTVQDHCDAIINIFCPYAE